MSEIPQTLGPVEKLQYLAHAAAMPNLSRVQLAVLVVLADMANATHGLAWPSYSTLATRTGATTRHAKTATKGLIDAGLIMVHEPGNRARSNRYRLNPKTQENIQGGDPQNTTQGSDLQDTRVVIPSDICGDLQSTKVVIPRTPESINQSEHQAKIDDRATGEGAAAPSRPRGPSGLHPPEPKTNQDRYPEFWQAMPMKTTVHEAEARIAEYVDLGFIYADIVAGAKRYSAYCQATKSPRRQSAVVWLNRQAWRDDWIVSITKGPAKTPESPQVDRKAKGKAPATDKTKKRQKLTRNPEHLAWEKKYEEINSRQSNNIRIFFHHAGVTKHDGTGRILCKQCNDVREARIRPSSTTPEIKICCSIGAPLWDDFLKSNHLFHEHREKQPPRWLEP